MTEIVKQLVEDIEKLVPKYVYVVYYKEDYDSFECGVVCGIISVNKTRREAFQSLFGGDVGDYGELDEWYNSEEGYRRVERVELN